MPGLGVVLVFVRRLGRDPNAERRAAAAEDGRLEDALLVNPDGTRSPPKLTAKAQLLGRNAVTESPAEALDEGEGCRAKLVVDGTVSPRIDVDTSLPAVRVIAALKPLAAARGLPKSIVVDNGPALISRTLDIWAHRHRVQLVFIPPGQASGECVHRELYSRFRDECLSAECFSTSPASGSRLNTSRQDYSEVRLRISAWAI